MYTYMAKELKKHYFNIDEILDEGYQIGETYEDYLNGKWILLSDEQLAFRSEFPSATPEEVFNMALHPQQERTLEQARIEKIDLIQQYDQSTNVNAFIYQGNEYWFPKEDRIGLYRRYSSEQTENVSMWLGNNKIIVPIEQALEFLDTLEQYAGECYDTTHEHIAFVSQSDSIEAIDAFDETAGYPEKIEFVISE